MESDLTNEETIEIFKEEISKKRKHLLYLIKDLEKIQTLNVCKSTISILKHNINEVEYEIKSLIIELEELTND